MGLTFEKALAYLQEEQKYAKFSPTIFGDPLFRGAVVQAINDANGSNGGDITELVEAYNLEVSRGDYGRSDEFFVDYQTIRCAQTLVFEEALRSKV